MSLHTDPEVRRVIVLGTGGTIAGRAATATDNIGYAAGEVAVEAGPLGAPLVVSPAGWHLSVAARWPRCLVAVAREPIGVDVEVATTALPDDLLTQRERKAMETLPPVERPLAGAVG